MTSRYIEPIKELQWLKQTIHQAHHDADVPVSECKKSSCQSIDDLIEHLRNIMAPAISPEERRRIALAYDVHDRSSSPANACYKAEELIAEFEKRGW